MRLLMKLIYIFILLSFYYPNYSYYGLILPTSSSHLLSADINYNLKKNLLFDNLLFDNLSTSLIKLPNNINLGLLKYCKGCIIDTNINKIICLPPMKSDNINNELELENNNYIIYSIY